MVAIAGTERTIIGETFSDLTIRIDGKHYINCIFERCRMEYAGGPPPVFDNCTLTDSGWWFDESAGNTIVFLQSMFNTFGKGGKDMVMQMLRFVFDSEVAPGTAHSNSEMIRQDMSLMKSGSPDDKR